MVLMLLALPMVFQSCSKDDDEVVSLPEAMNLLMLMVLKPIGHN
jgi:hypothetical protein